jgi:two-component sensor histidine kinase
VKNTLATVQSIAAQTLRSTPLPEEFRRSFQARLVALSHTHDALTQTQWQGADLRRLLEQELAPYGEGRVSIRGGAVLLPPGAALALGLVFHELATNAAKYGALTAETGQVSVRWEVACGGPGGGRHLELDWTETGGPPVSAPGRRGFGSRLIEQSLRGGTGEARLDFRPEGVAARFRVRLGGPETEGPVARRRHAAAGVGAERGGGKALAEAPP